MKKFYQVGISPTFNRKDEYILKIYNYNKKRYLEEAIEVLKFYKLMKRKPTYDDYIEKLSTSIKQWILNNADFIYTYNDAVSICLRNTIEYYKLVSKERKNIKYSSINIYFKEYISKVNVPPILEFYKDYPKTNGFNKYRKSDSDKLYIAKEYEVYNYIFTNLYERIGRKSPVSSQVNFINGDNMQRFLINEIGNISLCKNEVERNILVCMKIILDEIKLDEIDINKYTRILYNGFKK